MAARTTSQRQQLAMLARLEAPLAHAVYREKVRYVREQYAFYQVWRVFSEPLHTQHEANLRAVMLRAVKLVATAFGKHTAGGLKSAAAWLERKDGAGQTISQTFFDALATAWMDTFGAAKVKGMANTTREDLRRALLAVEEQQLDAAEARRAVQQVGQVSFYRATVIAQTETHNAAMFASMGTAQQLNAELGLQLKKEWVATEDERTRVSHMEVDGEKVDLNGAFNVGGEWLQYPGDPTGSPENVINCRCVTNFDE